MHNLLIIYKLESSLRGNYKVIDEAISGVCYYFMRLPRSFLLSVARNDGLVSTQAISPRNDAKKSNHTIITLYPCLNLASKMAYQPLNRPSCRIT
ncbi:hypothetical protein FEC77_00940 [Rickettsia parkeri]|nr:hypothetical protein FEC77_00940 [Rickettsia parkeri]